MLDQLPAILAAHKAWLNGEAGGRRADLSGALLSGAVLRDADLSGAVLRDAVLSRADLRDANLSGANLRGSVLRDAVLRDAVLRDAVLSGAVLRGAVMSGAVLRGADLSGADLSGALLSGAVLSGARNLPPIEAVVGLKEKIAFAVDGGRLLDMSTWHGTEEEDACNADHPCGTTHCLAGWAITLHPQGRLLELLLSTPTAAALIFHASGEQCPDFYCSNDEAMEWLGLTAASSDA